ncbi:MAG: penicillin-insensitive murein endopeptidase [Cyanobacteria bacterium J06606_4]
MIDTSQSLSPRSLAAERSPHHHEPHHHHGHEDSPCNADIPFTEEELAYLAQDSRALFTRMPFSGPGFECYGYGEEGRHHYGRSSVIQAVKHICGQWAKLHPDAPRIGVGDISLPDGGDTPTHATHEEGVDVDFSVVTNNGKEEPSNWQAGNYSQALTRDFVNLIFDNPVLAPRVVLFNDPEIAGVQYHAGHDDHLHVRFQVGPNVKAPEYTPDEGSLKLVTPYMKGDRVKALQEDLIASGIDLEADGVFGKTTEKAVKAFQRRYRLEIDGTAGDATLAKLKAVIAKGSGSAASS